MSNILRKVILKWINRFWDKSEDDYRMANIAGVTDNTDKEMMKECRDVIKRINKKYREIGR
jgi:hypothetical protein